MIGESAAHDVARHLLARIPGLSTSPTSPPFVKVGDVAPVAAGVSALGVFLRNVTGEQETPFVEGGNGHREERPEVQIITRADKDDARTGEALLEAIAAVIGGQSRSGMISGYFDAKLRGSGISSLGPDDDGFPLHVASFGLKRDARLLPLFTGAAVPGVVDEAFIRSLSSTTKGTRRTSIWSANAGANEALWWCGPADWLAGWGAGGGFFDGIVGRTALPFTLAGTANLSIDGSTWAYAAWRSTATGAGAKTVKTL